MTDRDDWEISIFVAQPTPHSPAPPTDAVETQSFPNPFSRVAKVSASAIEDQWNRTVNTLMNMTSTISDRANDWMIEEIEVGMTLSAKGELIFIAEAGAEASIKLTLKKKATVARDKMD